jgi:hypothetical protein
MMMPQVEIWTDDSSPLLVFEIYIKIITLDNSDEKKIHTQWKCNSFMLKWNMSKKKNLQHNGYNIFLNIHILWHSFRLLKI